MNTPIRTLIVDDTERDARLMILELKQGGYLPTYERVETAAAMRTALGRGPWDVVLSDQSMPRFSAPEALQVLIEHTPETPFIIVSGSVEANVVVDAMKEGACDYIRKDDLSLLVPAVDRALRVFRERQESKRAINALRESEERFALAMQASMDGLWDWSITSGKTFYSNRFLEMLGLEERALEGPFTRFVELVLEEDRPLFQHALEDHLRERAPCDLEVRVPGKDEHRYFSVRGQALWDATGSATRMVGSLRDVTARKRSEEALKEQLLLIQRQQEAIRTLSTPIIEVREGVLTVPVLGALEASRAQEMMDSVLNAVSQRSCRHLIIDLTGVATMDATAADHLIKLVSAVELLGTLGIVVGIQPAVAMAIVSVGVDLSRIVTLGNLGDALEYCMKI